jgi:hypothetical protein
MLKTLEKNWPYLSILLLLILLAVPFMWPQATATLGVIAVVLGVGAVIVFRVAGHVRAHREGKLDRAGLTRNILVDVPGLLLTMAAAALAGRAAGQFAGEAAGKAGWGQLGEILAALLAGLVVGVVVGLLVKALWGRLARAQAPA